MIFLRVIDRYLLRYFFSSMLVVVLAAGLTIIVVNMVDMLRYFVEKNVPFFTIIEYYFYFTGWILKTFFPMFVMLASLFSVSILARRHELMAMKASGLSLYRLLLPLALVVGLMSVGHFYFNEYIYPPANTRRLEIKEFAIQNKSRQVFSTVRDIRRQISPGYYYTLSSLNTVRGEGIDLKVYRTDDKRLVELISAKKAQHADHRWTAINGVHRVFAGADSGLFEEFDSLPLPDLVDTPDELSRKLGRPEDISLDDVTERIRMMKRAGEPYLREEVDLAFKYAFPASSFVVLLICVPLASNPRRSGVAASIGIGAVLTLTYFVCFKLATVLGYNGKLEPIVAAWAVNGLFFVIGVIVLLTARK